MGADWKKLQIVLLLLLAGCAPSPRCLLLVDPSIVQCCGRYELAIWRQDPWPRDVTAWAAPLILGEPRLESGDAEMEVEIVGPADLRATLHLWDWMPVGTWMIGVNECRADLLVERQKDEGHPHVR